MGIVIVRRIAAMIAVVLGIVWTGLAETVENVRGSQRPNSNLIDIYYDLDAVDGWSYTVEVAIEGRMNEVTATTFSGDIGTGIAPGKNRHIVWEAGVDWHGNKGDVKAVVTTTIEAPKGKNGKVQLWEGGPYWATTNIGANKPWEYGLYFWWGDTMGHRPSSGDKFVFDFSKTNSAIYTFGKSVSELRSAGWVTSDGVLSPAHDAAHVKWGGEWRMPTHQELYDLCYNKCDWTWTAMNGVHGYVVRGRGAYAFNSIFLPAAGNVSEHLRGGADSKGNYWSSVPVWSWDAYELSFTVNNHETNNRGGFRGGRSIRPVQDFAILITATGSSEWFFVDTTDKPDVIVHFNANGGVFRDKDGNEVTKFDQHFTYGEAQRLFTDELTPMKMDENGNQFVGWVRESPEVTTGSSIVAAREGRTWYEHDGVTEVTYYAVWTTTVTVEFYNDTDVSSGNRILSPNSLGNHLSWSVGTDVERYKSGESVQVLPGQRIIRLYVDDEYHWIAGRFDLGIDEPYFNRTYDYLELNIGNDFSDALIYGSTPREYVRRIYVEVGPDISQPETHGDVVFFYSAAVREELRGLINAQRGNVPAFDVSKVRISIGRTEVNQSGIVVCDLAHGLTGLELRKYYCLPTGIYYLKDVVYDADKGSGDPYWGAVIDSTFQNQLIEVKDGKITERTINFDVFGGANVARAVFDPREGACAKSEAWFPYYSSQYSAEGIRIVSKRALPTPERAGFRFMGWFTKESGGIEIKEGATISGDKVCWNLPDDLGSFDYTFKVYAQWTDMTDKWVNELFPDLVFDQSDDIVTLAKTMAANGTRTVAQCYSCGVNPTDPNDDLKIADFEMKDGKPVITLNHTEDGSGNSFLPRVKTLGKATLSDAEEWREVPEEGDQSMRFFKVEVEMP